MKDLTHLPDKRREDTLSPLCAGQEGSSSVNGGVCLPVSHKDPAMGEVNLDSYQK